MGILLPTRSVLFSGTRTVPFTYFDDMGAMLNSGKVANSDVIVTFAPTWPWFTRGTVMVEGLEMTSFLSRRISLVSTVSIGISFIGT